MNGRRVSYVVATRNRVSLIPEALAHWKELKGPDDELVVVDGGSSDGTYELLRAAQNDVVDILIHESDRSEAHALNKGFLAAHGRFLKPMGDDDFYYRDALETAYAVLDAHPEIDILLTGGETIDQTEVLTELRPNFYQWYPDGARLNATRAFVTMNGQGLVIRRSGLTIAGLLDPRHLHADTSFLTQATVRGATLRYLRVKAYSHRVSGISLSQLSMRKTYIYRAFDFTELSRWRYLAHPREAMEWILKRIGLRHGPAHPPEPLWDARLMD